MGIVVDLIIISVIGLSIFLGYRKGLASLAVNVCAFIVGILITMVLYKPITNLIINSTYIDEIIQNMIIEKTMDAINTETDSEIANKLIESAKNNMLSKTSRELAINIVSIIVIVSLIVLTKISLIFIAKLVKILSELPIINGINKIRTELHTDF